MNASGLPASDAAWHQGVEIPMRDGVALRADLWLPASHEPVPTVVFRTPYDKSALSSDFLRPQHCIAGGFACLVQDARGRFTSGGQWKAIQWDQEGPDTYDTVEWAASQPWSCGDVFLAGASYLGIVQWLGAMEQPPHLRGIAPALTTSWILDRDETGGALRLDHLVSWLAFMAVDWYSRRMAAGEPVDPAYFSSVMATVQDVRPVLETLPLTSIDAFADPQLPVSLSDMLGGEVPTTPAFDYELVRVPTLSVAGWYDVFCTGTIASHLQMRRHHPDVAHHLVVGPWAHANALPGTQGEVNFGIGAAAAVMRLHELTLAFFRTCLGSSDHAAPVHYFLMGADRWEHAPSWPPPGVSTEALHIHPGSGQLAPEAPETEAFDEYRYDPLDPCPTVGGRTLFLGRLTAGPIDQGSLLTRDDVLTYETDPLDDPLDVLGPVRLRLTVSSTAIDTDFTAKLCVRTSDGRILPFAEGSVRMRHRNGSDREDLLVPGEVTAVEIRLGHTAQTVLPGQRLVLLLSSSNFPHLDRNLNTGEPPGGNAPPVVAVQRIIAGGGHESRLELPVRRPQ